MILLECPCGFHRRLPAAETSPWVSLWHVADAGRDHSPSTTWVQRSDAPELSDRESEIVRAFMLGSRAGEESVRNAVIAALRVTP